MLTNSFIAHIEDRLSLYLGASVVCLTRTMLSGGSINNAVKLKTSEGTYFLKYNEASRFPEMFDSEAKGLALLRSTNTIGIPQTIFSGTYENNSYLVLEMLHSASRTRNYYELLGQQLAALHKNTSEVFGLDHDNYIGSLEQRNTYTASGSEFMVEHRFRPMVDAALNNNLMTKEDGEQFEFLYKKLPAILPNENPSLLHGDLWNGNIVTGPDGKAWLIDPSVHFGYRETDIAMTKLFGGFDAAFYTTYQHSFPLSAGWEKRIALFQLYPLLVHVKLFGTGYMNQVREVLRNV